MSFSRDFYFQESAWITGCDYLPGLRKVGACTERSLILWDHRAKGKNRVRLKRPHNSTIRLAKRTKTRKFTKPGPNTPTHLTSNENPFWATNISTHLLNKTVILFKVFMWLLWTFPPHTFRAEWERTVPTRKRLQTSFSFLLSHASAFQLFNWREMQLQPACTSYIFFYFSKCSVWNPWNIPHSAWRGFSRRLLDQTKIHCCLATIKDISTLLPSEPRISQSKPTKETRTSPRTIT